MLVILLVAYSVASVKSNSSKKSIFHLAGVGCRLLSASLCWRTIVSRVVQVFVNVTFATALKY